MSEFEVQPKREFMEAAIEMALQCDPVEHPVGAVVIKDDEIISRAGNKAHDDTTYHAERLAIASAKIALGSRRLEGCELYSTLEPCTLLCAGQILTDRLAAVTYGASTTDAQKFSQNNPQRLWTTNDITFREFADRTPWSATQIVGGYMKEERLQLFAKTPRSAEAATSATGQKLHITSMEQLAPGQTRAQLTFGTCQYDIVAPLDPEALLAWFPSYVAKAPSCANSTCRRLILPTQQVGQNNGHLSHLSCCDTLASFAGWLDQDAKLMPAFPTPPQS